MEFIEGISGSQALKHFGGRFQVGDATHIILRCAEAMHYAHERRVVHRDLKPENVMITRLESCNDFSADLLCVGIVGDYLSFNPLRVINAARQAEGREPLHLRVPTQTAHGAISQEATRMFPADA
jgi:serine/threonine protein kinase